MAKPVETKGANASVEKRLVEIRKIFRNDGAADAERALIELLRDEPGSSKAFAALARVLAKQKRFDDAARAAEKAKSLGPMEIDPLLMLGFIRLREKDHDAAAAAFSEAIALDASNTRALMGAAVVKLAQEKFDEAENLCRRALDQNPNMDRAHELLARITMRKGDKAAAIEQLKALATRSPENGRATRALVQLMSSDDRRDELMTFLRQDVEADPDNPRRVSRLAQVAVRIGQPNLAIDACRRLAESPDASITDKIRLITVLVENGDVEEAEKLVTALGDNRVIAPVAEKIRGDIALKTGKSEVALGRYKRACKQARVDPVDPGEEARAATLDDKVKLWRAHARRKIIEAIREHRAQMG